MKKILIFPCFIMLIYQSCFDRVDSPLSQIDNKSPGITVKAPPSLLVSESGTMGIVPVFLNSTPSNNVTINVSVSDSTEGTIISPFTGSTGTLTFTSTNWNEPQIIVVQGIDDNDTDGNQPFSLIFGAPISSDSKYNGKFKPADVTFTNVDNETPGVTVNVPNTTTLIVSESGTTNSFNVVLNSRPAGNVDIALSVSNIAEGSISTSLLTFTSTNWNTPQTVTVTGLDDNIADGNQNFTINFDSITSADPVYNGMTLPGPVNFTNIDNDIPGVLVTSPTTYLVNENVSNTSTFDIVLTSQPTSDVTMALYSSDTLNGIITGGTLIGNIITFTPANWNTIQTFSVNGFANLSSNNLPFTIIIGPTISLDPLYNGKFDSPDLNFIAINNSPVISKITVNTGDVLYTTGNPPSTDYFEIVLNSNPVNPVQITMTISDSNEALFFPSLLSSNTITFTGADWMTPQKIVVQGNIGGFPSFQNYTISFTVITSPGDVYEFITHPPINGYNFE